MSAWLKKLFSLLLFFVFFTPAGFTIDRATALLIEKEIKKHINEIIKIRRFLHMNPELSNREYETSKLITSKLMSLGIEVKSGIAGTGVSGLLEGDHEGFTIGLRADMDALPIHEKTHLPYTSLNPGVMHACGHDIHMSIALGTAIVLSNLKDKIKGNIKFIFQPAEEGPPKGEEGGAALMEKEGVLKEPPVMAIFGQHVWPSIDVGQILFSSGPIMASSDTVEIIIKGKSSHGARPYEGIDAITLAAHTIVSIQSFMDRMIDPSDPAVVSIGKIRGGGRSNIIADSVTLEGTVRTLTRTNRIKIETMLENIVQGITYPFGANYTFNYRKGAPPVYNHPGLADIMLPVLQEAVGKDNVLPLQPQMVAEDFSIFSQKIPGFYFFLGVKPPGQKTMPPLHSPFFNPDERSIALGIKIACYLLLDCLAYQDSFGSNFN